MMSHPVPRRVHTHTHTLAPDSASGFEVQVELDSLLRSGSGSDSRPESPQPQTQTQTYLHPAAPTSSWSWSSLSRVVLVVLVIVPWVLLVANSLNHESRISWFGPARFQCNPTTTTTTTATNTLIHPDTDTDMDTSTARSSCDSIPSSYPASDSDSDSDSVLVFRGPSSSLSDYLFRRFFGKLMSGQPVHVVLLGGSNSRGHALKQHQKPFHWYVMSWLESMFPLNQTALGNITMGILPSHTILNAAIPGAGSTYPSMCFHSLVPPELDADLLLMEFSANDVDSGEEYPQGEDFPIDPTHNVERLIRLCHSLLIPVVGVSLCRWQHLSCISSESAHNVAYTRYGVPSVSFRALIEGSARFRYQLQPLQETLPGQHRLTPTDKRAWNNDLAHLNHKGHELIGSALVATLRRLLDKVYPIPTRRYETWRKQRNITETTGSSSVLVGYPGALFGLTGYVAMAHEQAAMSDLLHPHFTGVVHYDNPHAKFQHEQSWITPINRLHMWHQRWTCTTKHLWDERWTFTEYTNHTTAANNHNHKHNHHEIVAQWKRTLDWVRVPAAALPSPSSSSSPDMSTVSDRVREADVSIDRDALIKAVLLRVASSLDRTKLAKQAQTININTHNTQLCQMRAAYMSEQAAPPAEAKANAPASESIYWTADTPVMFTPDTKSSSSSLSFPFQLSPVVSHVVAPSSHVLRYPSSSSNRVSLCMCPLDVRVSDISPGSSVCASGAGAALCVSRALSRGCVCMAEPLEYYPALDATLLACMDARKPWVTPIIPQTQTWTRTDDQRNKWGWSSTVKGAPIIFPVPHVKHLMLSYLRSYEHTGFAHAWLSGVPSSGGARVSSDAVFINASWSQHISITVHASLSSLLLPLAVTDAGAGSGSGCSSLPSPSRSRSFSCVSLARSSLQLHVALHSCPPAFPNCRFKLMGFITDAQYNQTRAPDKEWWENSDDGTD